ncbi:n-acetylglutamate synthase [Fibrella forsythiae]|uniref:N-acetylglutamate synthase n=1 Tax=Fibrella forsythiae TaxID=2817061 RepID=A0ABS3JF29_9BACT|nr:n-acetylglutamate synthase [Fibrella forsythiae]MBO0948046.1 n-acetylglutamate synthase [Fibrella forsythiae]
MGINYDNKIFRAVANTANGETSSNTVFHYRQVGAMLIANYSGGRIVTGHLLGFVDEAGHLDFRYHQINVEGKLMTGRCTSVPELLPTGKIRLHETWQWTSGDQSAGTSIIDEV